MLDPKAHFSLFPLSCLMQLICRSCVSFRNKPRERVCKGLLPSSGEPGERPVIFIYGEKNTNVQLSLFSCAWRQWPSWKISFIFPNFIFYSPATLIQLAVRGLCCTSTLKFSFMECTITQSDVTLPPCKSQQSKTSQGQSLILRYRDGIKLEIVAPDENQYIKDLKKDL